MSCSRGSEEADCVDVERRKSAQRDEKSVSGPITRQNEPDLARSALRK